MIVFPGSYVVTVPAEYVVVVSVVVAGAVVVCSVVVVLVCANAKGAISAQAIIRILFFIFLPFVLNFDARATEPRRGPFARSGPFAYWTALGRAVFDLFSHLCDASKPSPVDFEGFRELRAPTHRLT